MLKRLVEREKTSDKDVEQVNMTVLDSSVNEGEDDEGDNLITHPKSKSPSDVQISSDLTPEQKIEVSELVEEVPDVFTDTPGLTHLIEHDI